MHACVLRAAARIAVTSTLVLALFALGTGRTGNVAHAVGDCFAEDSLDSEEMAFLALINNHRAQNGRAPLGVSITLSRAAAWKSRDLGFNAYFAHDDLSRTWVQRIRACGYGYNTGLGENIAAGVASAQSAFDLWKNSSGHNANMLGTGYATIGIGRAYVAGSPYGWYWTTEFGGVDDGFTRISDDLAPIEQPQPAPRRDITPPSLTLSTSGRGRTLALTAYASDDTGVTRVEFWADGVLVRPDTTAPYSARILRRAAAVIEVRAYDAAGNAATQALRWASR